MMNRELPNHKLPCCPYCEKQLEIDAKKLDNTGCECRCMHCRLWIRIDGMTMADQNDLANQTFT